MHQQLLSENGLQRISSVSIAKGSYNGAQVPEISHTGSREIFSACPEGSVRIHTAPTNLNTAQTKPYPRASLLYPLVPLSLCKAAIRVASLEWNMVRMGVQLNTSATGCPQGKRPFHNKRGAACFLSELILRNVGVLPSAMP